jgi:K+-sensing histidine kinase KdpD
VEQPDVANTGDAPPGAGHDAPRTGAGDGIVALDFVGTGVFVAVATLATILPDEVARAAAVVDVVLFGVGVVAFLGAYAIAVSRSRTDAVSVAGVYFLADDVAPRPTRIRFRLALAIQVVVAIVTASVRPYTSVAFGVLVPMFGLGLMGLWGAKHGRFAPRDETP